MLIRRSAIAVASLAALMLGAPAVAQEKKTLKFAHVFPASHWLWQESAQFFQDQLAKETGGKVQFESYHAGALGKEGAALLGSGIADMAALVPSYEPAKLPLSSVAELPGMVSTACEGTAKLWHIAKDGGPLNHAEYKPLGVKVLYVLLLSPYEVSTTKKPVTSLKDMAGLKIRANGAAMDKAVRALGATPIRVTGGELFDALTRGTVDGQLGAIGSIRTASTEKALRYTVQGPLLGSAAIVWGLRQKLWDELPANERAAFEKAAATTQKHLCEFQEKLDANERAVLVKEHRFAVTVLSNDDNAQWTQRVVPIAAEWAKEMDSTGRPGSALLKAFQESPGR